MSFINEFDRVAKCINQTLAQKFCGQVPYGRLYEAMRYSLNAGGKRIRPTLAVKFAEACGGDAEKAILPACGIEMLHTYSLIHDDLPCMDDDDLRRGKPTNHVIYGECTAVLAGDALQAAAFRTILESDYSAEQRAAAALELSIAAGEDGMCAGQMLDMLGEGKKLTEEELNLLHTKKTAALLEASCVIGVILGGGTESQIKAAREYASLIGLAFQIRDDMLDCISTTEELGKPIGSDVENKKFTYVTLLGIDACEQIISECTACAKKTLAGSFENREFLCELADWLAERRN